MAAAKGQGPGFGANSWLVEEMYEQFVHDPDFGERLLAGVLRRLPLADAPSPAAAAATSPRVREIAADHGSRATGPGPGRRTAARAGAADRGGGRCTRRAASRRTRTGQADPRRRRGDRREHGTQPDGPDRHQLPQRPGQAARGQPQGRQRVPRPHRADQDQLHAPHRLRHRAGHRRRGPGDEEHLPRGCRRQAAPGRQRARQHGPRRRRVEVRRQPHARRARPPRRRHARLRRLPHLLRGDHPQGQEQQAHGRGLPGRQRVADEPRHDRHGPVRTAADAGPGRHRRGRQHRLPGRVRGRRPSQPQLVRRQQGRHDHQHVRPPHHPGRRVGNVPQAGARTAARRARVLRRHLPFARACPTKRSSGGRTRIRSTTRRRCSASRWPSPSSSVCTASAAT